MNKILEKSLSTEWDEPVNALLRVQAADLEASEREDPLTVYVLDHVLNCAGCGTALWGEDSLFESGCSTYKGLIEQVRAEAEPIRQQFQLMHISEEILEEHCFRRLSLADTWAVEEHLETCPSCAGRMAAQREFIQLLKTRLAAWKQKEREEPESSDRSKPFLFSLAGIALQSGAGECRV